MPTTREAHDGSSGCTEQASQRVKRLRAALREHSTAIDAVKDTVDAQKLQEFLDRNDELSVDVEDAVAQGLLSEAYLKITLLERALVAKVKTGLRVLDSDAFLECLRTKWSVSRQHGVPTRDTYASGVTLAESITTVPETSEPERPSEQAAANLRDASTGDLVVDLDALGKRFYRFFRTAPAPTFMFGLVNLSTETASNVSSVEQTPVVRERAARERNVVAATERAEQVSLNDVQEQVRTDVAVKQMFDFLEEHGPIELYDLVLDTSSFGRTIENLFHLSFLIRDGRVELWREHDQYMVRPLHRHGQSLARTGQEPAPGTAGAELVAGKQAIFRFDWQDWSELCMQRHGKRTLQPGTSPNPSHSSIAAL
jgi:hypothetical protein